MRRLSHQFSCHFQLPLPGFSSAQMPDHSVLTLLDLASMLSQQPREGYPMPWIGIQSKAKNIKNSSPVHPQPEKTKISSQPTSAQSPKPKNIQNPTQLLVAHHSMPRPISEACDMITKIGHLETLVLSCPIIPNRSLVTSAAWFFFSLPQLFPQQKRIRSAAPSRAANRRLGLLCQSGIWLLGSLPSISRSLTTGGEVVQLINHRQTGYVTRTAAKTKVRLLPQRNCDGHGSNLTVEVTCTAAHQRAIVSTFPEPFHARPAFPRRGRYSFSGPIKVGSVIGELDYARDY